MFFAQKTFAGPTSSFSVEDFFALHAWQSSLFKPWQMVTHIFLHGDFGHILGNMFALWMFGSVLENVWGPKRFLLFYILCGVGASVIHLLILSYQFVPMASELMQLSQLSVSGSPAFNDAVLAYSKSHQIQLTRILSENNVSLATPGIRSEIMEFLTNNYKKSVNTATLGASGAVFGILMAFVYLFPNTKIYIYFLFPIKAKWLGVLYFSYELFFAVRNTAGDNVARWAHVGGALVGLLLVYLWNKKTTRWN
jgi:membrane associated rhomboid family serine protease